MTQENFRCSRASLTTKSAYHVAYVEFV